MPGLYGNPSGNKIDWSIKEKWNHPYMRTDIHRALYLCTHVRIVWTFLLFLVSVTTLGIIILLLNQNENFSFWSTEFWRWPDIKSDLHFSILIATSGVFWAWRLCLENQRRILHLWFSWFSLCRNKFQTCILHIWLGYPQQTDKLSICYIN